MPQRSQVGFEWLSDKLELIALIFLVSEKRFLDCNTRQHSQVGFEWLSDKLELIALIFLVSEKHSPDW